jgi:uncharacterized membrane protein
MIAAVQRQIRHILYDLRDGFLIRPVAIAAALGAAGTVIPFLEIEFPILDRWTYGLPLLATHDPTAAQGVLAAIISAMMTVVSIVLSVLLVALTVASMQFSPRILTAFVQDRVNQHTIGIFLGTFLYCLAVYPMEHSAPAPSTPAVAALGGMFLAGTCSVALVRFVHHIARSINVNFITERIARETERVIDNVHRLPKEERLDLGEHPTPAFEGPLVVATRSGYVRFVEIRSLVAAARKHGIAVRIERRIGHYVAEGSPLLRMSRKKENGEAIRSALLEAFDIGPMRTMEQDVEFGLLQLVDIALKAISPAVNDPSTAINCIDQLTRLLIRIAGREPVRSLFSDPPGVVRVVFPRTSFGRLLNVAFDQIVAYGKTDAAVSLRVMRALEDVAFSATGADLDAVRAVATATADTCCQALPAASGAEIRKRLARVVER